MKSEFSKVFFVLFFLTFFIAQCTKDEVSKPPTDDVVAKEQKALLDETVGKIETALSAGDHAAFLGYFSAEYINFYKDAVQQNPQKLVQFSEIFKTRKLLNSDKSYAVYQVTYNGKTFEITMIFDNDGKWKIKDM